MGITAIDITVGKEDNDYFELEQVEQKSLNNPYFERIDYDLSMPLARQVSAVPWPAVWCTWVTLYRCGRSPTRWRVRKSTRSLHWSRCARKWHRRRKPAC